MTGTVIFLEVSVTPIKEDARRHGDEYGLSQRVVRIVLTIGTLTAVPLGLGSNHGEGRHVCKCTVISQYGDTLNNSRGPSHLVRLMEREYKLDVLDHLQDTFP
ncbi:hypothetical protein TNCV_908491 [Trichonephila clavipes]|nr:hypothetical protein TNCV_908491 [Trichonephila clavipes]